MSDREVVIVGYSGHAYVVADAAISAGINLTHYTDKNNLKNNPFDLKYLGFENDNGFFDKISNQNFVLGIGDNIIRDNIYNLLISNEVNITNVIHPSSLISNFVKLGKGNFISKRTAINPLVVIEDACIINTGAIIEHECFIGKSSHIGPGAVLAGNVSVGKRSFIGANTVIKEGITIGDDVIIGAGSVIIRDVPSKMKVVGNPGKYLN